MVERIACDDPGEGIIREREGLSVADSPSHVGQPERQLPCPGLLDHGDGQVNSGDVPGHSGDLTGDQSRPTAHVQDLVRQADPGRISQKAVKFRYVPGCISENGTACLVNWSTINCRCWSMNTSRLLWLRQVSEATVTFRPSGREILGRGGGKGVGEVLS